MEYEARKFRRSALFFSKAIMMAVLFGIFAAVWWFKYPEATYYGPGNYMVLAFYLVVLTTFSTLYGALSIGILRLGEVIYSFSLTLAVTNALAYAVFTLIARGLLNGWWLILATAVQLLLASIAAFFINRLYFIMYPARNVAVVYASRGLAREVITKMSLKKDRYHVCVTVNEDEGYDAIIQTLEGYAAVLFCDIDANLRHRLFSYCSLHGKRVYVLPSFQDVLMRSSHLTQIFDTPVFYSKNSGPTTEQAIAKRLIDIVVSALGLLITSPVIALVALCVKLSDRGPVLYSQERLTQNGRVFRLYKFRSMIVDAEKDGGPRLASVGDDRITPVGRILRKLRLDELPQLWNILRGDMSLVGPRPERPEIALQYQAELPEFALRLRMKAGLTGYAQIYGRYNTTMRDKLLLDLLYTESYNLLLDFKMMFMTLKVIFMPESTEGIAAGTFLPGEAVPDDTKDAE